MTKQEFVDIAVTVIKNENLLYFSDQEIEERAQKWADTINKSGDSYERGLLLTGNYFMNHMLDIAMLKARMGQRVN